MEESTAITKPASLFARVHAGYMGIDVRKIRHINVEDMALAGGYFLIFWLFESVKISGGGFSQLQPWSSAWQAIAIVGCAGVLLRRTSPTAMAILCGSAAIGLILAGHAGAFFLVFEFFFSLTLFGPLRASKLAAKGAWVLTVLLLVVTLALSRNASETVMVGILAVVTLLTPVEWAGNLRNANRLTESESARANAVQDAAAQRLLAERSAHELSLERERAHMARELHDVLSARLSAIALQSGAVLHPDSPPGVTASVTVLRQIRSESVAGLEELNRMIRLLHNGALEETAGTLADLPSMVEKYRCTGAIVDYKNSLHDAGNHLPPHVQSALYRIASEALTNAARHAPGHPASIAVVPALEPRSSKPGVELKIANPLPNSPTGPTSQHPDHGVRGTGTGIPSMHFRASHAGGTLFAGARNGRWEVVMWLPATHLDATNGVPL